jgi:hypothetical protein
MTLGGGSWCRLGKDNAMTTIILLNTISSFLAAAGFGAYFALERRRRAREAAIEPIYVFTDRARPV